MRSNVGSDNCCFLLCRRFFPFPVLGASAKVELTREPEPPSPSGLDSLSSSSSLPSRLFSAFRISSTASLSLALLCCAFRLFCSFFFAFLCLCPRMDAWGRNTCHFKLILIQRVLLLGCRQYVSIPGQINNWNCAHGVGENSCSLSVQVYRGGKF